MSIALYLSLLSCFGNPNSIIISSYEDTYPHSIIQFQLKNVLAD